MGEKRKPPADRNLTTSDDPASHRNATTPIQNLTNEQRLQQVSVRHHVEKISSGPLPSPEDFKKYEQALPGAADRILSMAEREQQIRADDHAKGHVNDKKRINAAVALGLSLITVAGIATLMGAASIAIPFGLAGVFATIFRQLFVWLRTRSTPK